MKSMDVCFSDTGDHASPGNQGVTKDAIPAPPQPPRKRGRPPGYPKSGGRVKAQAPWTSELVRELALPPAMELLVGVCKGEPQLVDDGLRGSADKQAGRGCWRRPTLQDRMKAASILIGKTLPDLRSTELAASVEHREAQEPRPPREVARAIMAALSKASAEAGVNFRIEETGGPVNEDRCVTKAFCLSREKKSEEDV